MCPLQSYLLRKKFELVCWFPDFAIGTNSFSVFHLLSNLRRKSPFSLHCTQPLTHAYDSTLSFPHNFVQENKILIECYFTATKMNKSAINTTITDTLLWETSQCSMIPTVSHFGLKICLLSFAFAHMQIYS